MKETQKKSTKPIFKWIQNHCFESYFVLGETKLTEKSILYHFNQVLTPFHICENADHATMRQLIENMKHCLQVFLPILWLKLQKLFVHLATDVNLWNHSSSLSQVYSCYEFFLFLSMCVFEIKWEKSGYVEVIDKE